MALAAVLGLSLSDLADVGGFLVGVGVVGGAWWAVFNYRRTRRQDQTRWLNGVFKDFYFADRFDAVRNLLEYDHPESAGPLLDALVADHRHPISERQMELVRQLDTLIAYFEHILYLEESDQLSVEDRRSLSRYWFHVMADPERPALLAYVDHFGWRRVAAELGVAREARRAGAR